MVGASSLYTGHIPTSPLQKILLGIGSAAAAILDPRRGDMVATFGEVSGERALEHMRARMLCSEGGQRILETRPTFTSETLKELRKLSPGSLGRDYAEFMDGLSTTPEERPPVAFVDSEELAYVMRRYRQCHDVYHSLLGMPTNLLGEVGVKWVEALQLGLPMAVTGGLFGAGRLYPQQRIAFEEEVLPWALRAGQEGAFLLSLEWEQLWEEPTHQLRSRLGFPEPPPSCQPRPPKQSS